MSAEITNHLFNEEELKEVDRILAQFPEKMAGTLPLLWMIQEKYGWISRESMEYVGQLCDVPYDHVLGVVTFYTMYNQKPVGKVHLQICTNVSCMLRGADRIFDHISDKYNIKNKETTEDGMVTIERVECLGSCATAPMMQVNNKEFYENLDMNSIDALIDELKQKYSSTNN